MTAILPDTALDQLFHEGRSIQKFTSRPVEEAVIDKLYDLVRLGPTGFNSQPGRYLFLRSAEARERLAPALSGGNRDKTLAAPLSVVIAYDGRFPDPLPALFGDNKAKDYFDANPQAIDSVGTTNATLQAGYLILAARALGLDAGPMTGFDKAAVDRIFFSDRDWRTLLIVNLGYGDRSELAPRRPRLERETAVRVI